jgi:hypothetical protein
MHGPEGSRPYLYEAPWPTSTLILLHVDYDPDEETWVIEGLSEFAELLCGYGIRKPCSRGDEQAENSLVLGMKGDLEILLIWPVSLCPLPLRAYGGPFIRRSLATRPRHLWRGNARWLPSRAQALRRPVSDWSVQLLIDADARCGATSSRSWTSVAGIGTPDVPNRGLRLTGVAVGQRLVWIQGVRRNSPDWLQRRGLFVFPTEWTSDGSVLWSGTGDLLETGPSSRPSAVGTLPSTRCTTWRDYWTLASPGLTDGATPDQPVKRTRHSHDPARTHLSSPTCRPDELHRTGRVGFD